jgi:hypothetical protein
MEVKFQPFLVLALDESCKIHTLENFSRLKILQYTMDKKMAGPLAGPDAPENTRVFPCRKSNNIHYTD